MPVFLLNLYLASLVAAGLITAASLPLWRRWCLRAGWVDDPGHRKIHRSPMPLAGGMAILTGLLLTLLGMAILVGMAWVDRESATWLRQTFARNGGRLGVIVAGGLGMTLLGWLDDRIELRPALKFAGQLLIALLVAKAGMRVTLFVPSLLFSYAITILWILTVTNAINFLDNMNGLATGLGAIAALGFGVAAHQGGHSEASLLAFLVAGATLGFLPWNFPKATAFLGDAGSHLLGYLLAVLAILPSFYSAAHPDVWAVFTPLLLLAVPLGDLAWVVLIRWQQRKPFYQGDTNHLSHRLVRRGLSQVQAVGLIWALAAGLSVLAMWL